jgi:hypothetical protein
MVESGAIVLPTQAKRGLEWATHRLQSWVGEVADEGFESPILRDKAA